MTVPTKRSLLLSLSSLLLLPIVSSSSSASLDCSSLTSLQGIPLSELSFPISISETLPTPPTETLYQIDLDFCKPLTDSKCPEGTRVCLTKTNKSKGNSDRLLQVIPVSGQTEGSEGEDELSRKEGSDTSHLILHGGIYNTLPQSTSLSLICDSKSEKDSIPSLESYDELKGLLKMNWKHSIFCSSSNPSDPSSGSPDKEKDKLKEGEDKTSDNRGWGFFSYFFFLIFLIFSIYLGTGIYQNHKAGESGINLLPNREFWKEVPFMIRDLCGRGVRLGRSGGGGRGEYEAL